MALKKKLREVLDEQTTTAGRMVDGVVQFLIATLEGRGFHAKNLKGNGKEGGGE